MDCSCVFFFMFGVISCVFSATFENRTGHLLARDAQQQQLSNRRTRGNFKRRVSRAHEHGTRFPDRQSHSFISRSGISHVLSQYPGCYSTYYVRGKHGLHMDVLHGLRVDDIRYNTGYKRFLCLWRKDLESEYPDAVIQSGAKTKY